jgi:hypothetical protein
MEQDKCIINDACWFVELNVATQCSAADEAKVVRFVDVLKFTIQIATSVVFFSN